MHLSCRNQRLEAKALFHKSAIAIDTLGLIANPITHIQGVKRGRTYPTVPVKKAPNQVISTINRQKIY